MVEAQDLELLQEFRAEVRELLGDTDAAFLRLEQDPRDKESINSVFRAFHTVKGNSAYFGLTRVKEFAHGVESALDELRKGALVATPDLIDGLLAAKDHLARLVESCEDLSQVPPERDGTLLTLLHSVRSLSGDVLTDAQMVLREVVHTLREHANELPELTGLAARAERVVGKSAEEAAAPGPAAAETGTAGRERTTQPKKDAGGNRSLRIDESRLDGFFASVGDLLNFAEAFANMQRALEDHGDVATTVREWKAVNRNFGVVVDRLQRQVAEIRQVPIQNLFQKISRIARDTARSIGKQVQVQLHGAELLIEKSYLEVIEAPMMHLIRNAIDHGLEAPHDRAAAGKDAQGTVQLRFVVHKEHYEIAIVDDGRGIDPEKVRNKAVAKQLLTAEEAARLGADEAVNLVFRPGFSTAERVTDLSGRGVGLDVVQDAVQRRHGSIALESRVGAGSTFRLTLPRSTNTMVTESLLIQVGRDPYLIPLESLRETLDLTPQMVSQLPEGGEVVTVRDRSYPYRDLAGLFGVARGAMAPQAVVVHDRRNTFVLGVDKALGLQKVAVKQLRDPLVERPYLRGAAVLGNGNVGLVLNVSQLMQ